jgi:hypothetical protein
VLHAPAVLRLTRYEIAGDEAAKRQELAVARTRTPGWPGQSESRLWTPPTTTLSLTTDVPLPCLWSSGKQSQKRAPTCDRLGSRLGLLSSSNPAQQNLPSAHHLGAQHSALPPANSSRPLPTRSRTWKKRALPERAGGVAGPPNHAACAKRGAPPRRMAKFPPEKVAPVGLNWRADDSTPAAVGGDAGERRAGVADWLLPGGRPLGDSGELCCWKWRGGLLAQHM